MNATAKVANDASVADAGSVVGKEQPRKHEHGRVRVDVEVEELDGGPDQAGEQDLRRAVDGPPGLRVRLAHTWNAIMFGTARGLFPFSQPVPEDGPARPLTADGGPCHEDVSASPASRPRRRGGDRCRGLRRNDRYTAGGQQRRWNQAVSRIASTIWDTAGRTNRGRLHTPQRARRRSSRHHLRRDHHVVQGARPARRTRRTSCSASIRSTAI